MPVFRITWTYGLLAMSLGAGNALAETPAGSFDFEKSIAKVLASHCLDCHNPSQKSGGLDLSTRDTLLTGGDSGEAVVTKDPDASYLLDRVREGSMPPEEHGKPLTPKEIAGLTEWIEQGITWPEKRTLSQYEFSTDKRGGYDWWSLQRVVATPVPEGTDCSLTPIDRFVEAKLFEHKLQPAATAGKRTLIRRATLDLLGLPPTPEQVEEFVDDGDPDAYARLIDRLLASPHYGERWGRHWLDVVRFGESDGFEHDKMRNEAWYYRDYVINSLNSDKPYDLFVREQLAGDVLEPVTRQGITGSGFLVAGPWDEVQNVGASKPEMRRAHEEQMEELIGVVTQTFLGVTVNCARCHDHKFDPVPQQDYYRIKAVFEGVDHGLRPLYTPAEMAEHQLAVEPIQQGLAEAKQQLAELENSMPAHAVLHDGDLDKAVTPGRFGLALDAKQVRCKAATKPGYHTPPLSVQCWTKLDGKAGFNILVANLPKESAEHWELYSYAGTGHFSVYMPGFQPAEIVSGFDITDSIWHHVGMSFDGETVRLYVDAQLVKETAVTKTRNGGPEGSLFIGSYPPHKIGCDGFVDDVCISQEILPFDQLPDAALEVSSKTLALWNFDTLVGHQVRNAVEAPLPADYEAALVRTRVEIEGLQTKLDSMKVPQVYSGVRNQPAVTHLLDRGDAEAPKQVVTPGGLSVVRVPGFEWNVTSDMPEAQRRKLFAEWVTHPENPLTARVLVNRVWQFHFGQGLVATPSDLGFNGGEPSHPQLLDWLAHWFVQNGWSIKKLHRLIMTSATYQQTSTINPKAADVDADNRLLWRFSARRLEAEAVRDCMLGVSGDLNRQLGGPSFKPFTVTVFNTHFYHLFDKGEPEYNRRTVYRVNVNTARSPLLVALDCPAPSVSAPKRRATTTTLQALSLMNDSFVVRQAERFAQRIIGESGANPSNQVTTAFKIAYNRDPADDEQVEALTLVEKHGLSSLCWALLNSSEFLYLP